MDMIRRLTCQLGADHVVTAADAMAPYLREQRGLFADRSVAAVLRPSDTAGVARAVAACAELGLTVVPQGGNTGLCGGAAGRGEADTVVLSLERLNRIRDIQADDFSITVEAGCTLAAVQAAAASVDRLFPLSYAAEAECQIGGNLATNAGGMNVLRYGNARDLTLGLEVVLADGRVWDGLRSLRKDNSGYDLRDLFIGAEGTLGLITAATLKLFPPVRERATAIVGLATAEAAVALFGHLRTESGDTVTSCELMGRRPLEYTLRYATDCHDPLPAPHPWYLLVELTSSAADAQLPRRLEAALAASHGAGSDYRIARGPDEAADFWRLRNSIPGAQKGAGASIKNDISVPTVAMPAFLTEASTAVEAACPGVRVCAFGHLGDGNVHFNLTRPEAMNDEDFLPQWGALTRVVNDRVAAYRGSFAAEHGVGQLKPDEVGRLKDPVEQDLMRALKQALDPDNRLNPGKLVPPGGG